jgi:signal transduction histidine kinase
VRDQLRHLIASPFNLAEALRSFVDDVENDANARLHVAVTDSQLSKAIALLMYHIAREGVMNALQHAASRDVRISIVQRRGEVLLTIRDHGVGFDSRMLEYSRDTGLGMMRERVQVGGGVLEIESLPPAGTTVRVTFPV